MTSSFVRGIDSLYCGLVATAGEVVECLYTSWVLLIQGCEWKGEAGDCINGEKKDRGVEKTSGEEPHGFSVEACNGFNVIESKQWCQSWMIDLDVNGTQRGCLRTRLKVANIRQSSRRAEQTNFSKCSSFSRKHAQRWTSYHQTIRGNA